MNRQLQAVLIPSASYRTVLGYALFGTIWILSSDTLVARFVSTGHYETASIIKGLLFIALTFRILGLLLRRRHEKATSLNLAKTLTVSPCSIRPLPSLLGTMVSRHRAAGPPP